MKKAFHLSVVIGIALADEEATQGQTEEAQAKTDVDLIAEERGSASPFWATSSALTAPSAPR